MKKGDYYLMGSQLYKIVDLVDNKYYILDMSWMDGFGIIDEDMWKEKCSKTLVDNFFKPLPPSDVKRWIYNHRKHCLQDEINKHTKRIDDSEMALRQLNKELNNLKLSDVIC